MFQEHANYIRNLRITQMIQISYNKQLIKKTKDKIFLILYHLAKLRAHFRNNKICFIILLNNYINSFFYVILIILITAEY